MATDRFGIVGTSIAGTYEVEAVVAEGGFAIVYRAHHTGFGAKVALKCLKLSQKVGPERQAEFLAQFKAEAALLFQLSSSIPTVVRPLHIDALTTKEGTFVPYMVLEWLEGETLAAIIHHRAADSLPPPPLKKLVRLLGPVAQALARAHDFTTADGQRVSIVHQDIKPENIFVASAAGEQVVKILDYGVAKAQSFASQVAGPGAAERSGVHSFTPAYAAPEQWAPDKFGETGAWTDVWGLALTLVEAMAGRLIIDGDIATMMNIALDPVARPTPLNNDVEVSPEVEEVFERALALNPQHRQSNVGEFWDELLVALGMKEGPRDARREGGGLLREERVAVPKARPAPKGATLARVKLQPRAAPKAPLAQPRHRLTIDDPFELDDLSGPVHESPLPAPRGPKPEPRMSLELKLPSEPPGPGPIDLEAALPSLPPVAVSSLEASIPSLAPSAAAPEPAPRPAAPPRPPSMELEVPQAVPRKPQVELDPIMSRNALDVDAAAPSQRPEALEASLRPAARAPAGPARSARSGDLDLGAEAPALRVDFRSELPPRPEPPPVRPAPQRRERAPSFADRGDAPPKKRVNLLGVGAGLIVAAIAIGAADRALRHEDGTSVVSLGPVTPMVLAGLLFAVGLGLLIYQFLPHDEQ
ncbi:MAG: serine/threonine protein kinase [Myxococcales bacterium]|nr:serine/threonine protein kinase [Myxococcales bacterium]